MTLVAQRMVNELVHSPHVPFKDTCEYAGHMTNLRGVTKSLTSKQQMTLSIQSLQFYMSFSEEICCLSKGEANIAMNNRKKITRWLTRLSTGWHSNHKRQKMLEKYTHCEQNIG